MLSSHTVHTAPKSSKATPKRNTAPYDFCSSSIVSRRATPSPSCCDSALHEEAEVKHDQSEPHEPQFPTHRLRLGQPDVQGVADVRDPKRLHHLREVEHLHRTIARATR